MKQLKGFSLAEALITLLIVCIIAIASAPMITKKAKKSQNNLIWITDTQIKTAVTPVGQRDIRLGDEKKDKKQGIVVVGTMYFKDRNGNVIGWIAEDGSNSFSQQSDYAGYDYEAVSAKQDKLMKMAETLMTVLQNDPSFRNNAMSGGNNKNSGSSSSRRAGRQTPMMDISSFQNMDENQMQQQINALMQMLNTQNR